MPARKLLRDALPSIARKGITLIGIAITNLDPRGSGVQLELSLSESAREEALDGALDDLRERFGAGSVTRGAKGAAGPRSLAEARR